MNKIIVMLFERTKLQKISVMCKKVTGYHLYKNVDGVNNGYYELWRMAGKA